MKIKTENNLLTKEKDDFDIQESNKGNKENKGNICAICTKSKCKYYNNKIPYLSTKLCTLCYGRKEVCYKLKPDLYKIYLCNNCVPDDYIDNKIYCDRCVNKHELCLCVSSTDLSLNYPYTIPY